VLAYWLPRFECYVDVEGRPVALPPAGSGRAATLVDHDGDRVAALVHDSALSYQPELLEVVCAAADLALEQERLQAELKAHAEEVAGSRARIVEAGDTARRRLERDLHDGAQQQLVALAMALRLAEARIQSDPNAAEQLVASARADLEQSLAELRELARGIHPAVLDHGLAVALDSLVARSAIPVSLAVKLEDRLPEPVEIAAYFVASEALANVGKYAQASAVTIKVSRDNGFAIIEIADNGVGGADDTRGSGLRGLADRVEAIGGHLQVVSPTGGGTVLTAEMPCAS
jgi:signal transduction histidine kinase